MRRHAFAVTALVLLLGSCGGGSGKSSSTSTVPIPSTSVTTDAPETTTTPPATLPNLATTTTAAPCPDSSGATAPVTTGTAQVPALLDSVGVTSALCVDLVRFAFTTKTDAPPSCVVSYQDGPFTADASGIAVSVAGNAFVVVRCTPAYGYDFDSGKSTYTGPPLITPKGTRSVRQLVETGDFEGVLTWVIGLEEQRPYRVAVAATPVGSTFASTLVITFS